MITRSPLARFRRFFYLRRRTLAALAAFVAVLAALTALQPDGGASVSVLAAARDLPGGTVLTASDLLTLELPPDAAPADAATTPESLVGRTLNAPVSARGVLTATDVATGQALVSAGHVAIALPLTSEALAPLIQVGSRIDILAAGGNTGEVIASDVRVVGAPAAGGSTLGVTTPDRVALVEVTPEIARRLAVASQTGNVVIALR